MYTSLLCHEDHPQKQDLIDVFKTIEDTSRANKSSE